MRRRVVVTGMGCVNPLGNDVESMWQGVKEGKSGVDFTTLFDASKFPTRISAEVRNWDVANDGEDAEDLGKARPPHQVRHRRRPPSRERSGVLGTVDPDRFGVYLGAGEGQQDFYNFSHMMVAALKNGELDLAAFIQEGLKRLDPQLELEQEPNMPVAYVASQFSAEGPNVNCLTACAASSQAVGEATEIIRRGEADVMLSGGAHSMIHPFGVTGFNLLTALSDNNDEPHKASPPLRPQPRRLHPRRRRRRWSSSKTTNTPRSRGAADLRRNPRLRHHRRRLPHHRHPPRRPRRDRLHENGAPRRRTEPRRHRLHQRPRHQHAVNDRVETIAIKEVFGDRAYKVPVSSTKSMMGHLIAAAGVTELIICLLAIRDGVLPPTINYENPDPECDLDYIPNAARPAPLQYALSNSFGFGGQNISLVVGRFKA